MIQVVSGDLEPAEAAAQIRFLEEEVALLRRKLTESPRHARVLEQRLAESASRLAQLSARNEKLTDTLKDARGQLDRPARGGRPPRAAPERLWRLPGEASPTRRWTCSPRVAGCASRCRPAVEPPRTLQSGQTVRLNEALTVVEALDFERVGEVCGLREVLSGHRRRTVWPAVRW